MDAWRIHQGIQERFELLMRHRIQWSGYMDQLDSIAIFNLGRQDSLCHDRLVSLDHCLEECAFKHVHRRLRSRGKAIKKYPGRAALASRDFLQFRRCIPRLFDTRIDAYQFGHAQQFDGLENTRVQAGYAKKRETGR